MDGQQLLHDIKCLLFLDSRSIAGIAFQIDLKAAFSNQVDPLDRHKWCKEAPQIVSQVVQSAYPAKICSNSLSPWLAWLPFTCP